MTFRGSSPLTRGKPDQDTELPHIERLIPAHAGKTRDRRQDGNGGEAHPRSRGENATLTAGAGMKIGSSPLTRGKPVLHGVGEGTERLIPAHAGKTRWWSGGTRTWPAHPRSRGENPSLRTPPIPESGSSPLTRGKPVDVIDEEVEGRLIPAHAGKTRRASTCRGSGLAHPRSRGENVLAIRRAAFHRGSSPLTRGKLALQAVLGAACRLIPAHAGKTPWP